MPNNEKVRFSTMRSAFFFGLIIVLALAMLYIIRPFLYPIFWAAIVAVVFYPMYDFLHRYIKISGLTAIISLILVFVVLFLPLVLMTLLLINESINLYNAINQNRVLNNVGDLANWVQNTALAPYIQDLQAQWTNYASSLTQKLSSYVFNSVKNITQNSLRFFFMLFMMFYTLYYLFKDGRRIIKRVMMLSPLGDTYENMLFERFTSTTRATIKGTFAVGAVQGILGGIMFWVTGIEGAFIWGVVMTMLSVIPAMGPVLVWLPAGIAMLLFGNTWQGLTILIFGVLVISTIDNLLRPVLVGKDIQMHPLVVLFSTLGGIFMFGVSGFIIGPIIAALFLAIVSIYHHYYRHELENN